MPFRRKVRLLAAVLAVLVVAAFIGCSKDKTTNPNPGGGGGGNTPFNSGSFSSGQTFAHTFPNATTSPIGYHCTFHSPMTGTVSVDAGAAADTDTVRTVGNTAFSPNAVTVKPGGTVIWINAGGTHTVTSD